MQNIRTYVILYTVSLFSVEYTLDFFFFLVSRVTAIIVNNNANDLCRQILILKTKVGVSEGEAF